MKNCTSLCLHRTFIYNVTWRVRWHSLTAIYKPQSLVTLGLTAIYKPQSLVTLGRGGELLTEVTNWQTGLSPQLHLKERGKHVQPWAHQVSIADFSNNTAGGAWPWVDNTLEWHSCYIELAERGEDSIHCFVSLIIFLCCELENMCLFEA